MDSQKFLQYLKYCLHHRQRLILAIASALFILFWSAVCFWKYHHFLYNGIDLAIFSQIFWNMLDGRFFVQSIHPHLSLGDHAELIMPLLLPLYSLWADPRMLLLLQEIALGFCAWPIYWLARRRFAAASGRISEKWQRLGPLLIALAWLANPTVAYIGLFEFHVLTFALPFLLMALLAYDRGQFRAFLIWIILAMLVREDVPLAVAAFGLLAWIEKKPWKWRLLPPVMAGLWFVGAMALIDYFQPAGGYKFMVYYSWLGDTPGQALLGILTDPVKVLLHLLKLSNLEMLLGMLMPLLFVPLLAPAGLLLAILPLVQILLGEPGGGQLVITTHYSVLFMPAIFYAGINGLIRLPAFLRKRILQTEKETYYGAILVLLLGVVYSALMIGPVRHAFMLFFDRSAAKERAAIAQEMIRQIPDGESVVASYGLLPQLANRQELYGLHYQFLGVGQFAAFPYQVPEETRYMAIDTQDLIAYDAQLRSTSWTAPHYEGGYARLRRQAGALIFNRGHFQLYDRNQGAYRQPVISDRQLDVGPKSLGLGLEMVTGSSRVINDLASQQPILEIATAWTAEPAPENDWLMRIKLIDDQGELTWEEVYPFANGLFSATELSAKPISSLIRIPVSRLPAGHYRVLLQVKQQESSALLDGLSSVGLAYGEWEVIGNVAMGDIDIE